MDGRPDKTLHVHTGMLEKAVILGGQEGLDQDRGHLGKSNGRAAFIAELTDQHPIPAVDAQWFLQPEYVGAVNIGQLGHDGHVHPDQGGHGQENDCCDSSHGYAQQLPGPFHDASHLIPRAWHPLPRYQQGMVRFFPSSRKYDDFPS